MALWRLVLWSRIRNRIAEWLWSRLHSYWLAWSLMSFGYTRFHPNPDPNPSIVEGIPVVLAKNVVHYMLNFRIQNMPISWWCRCTKPCCDWWIALAHVLTVSALFTGRRDHRQSKTRSRIRDHRRCVLWHFHPQYSQLHFGPANRPFAFESNTESNQALRFEFESNLESNRP